MIVEGQELVSLKMQSTELQMQMAPDGVSGSTHHALVVRVTVEDMIIKDLQVASLPCCMQAQHAAPRQDGMQWCTI